MKFRCFAGLALLVSTIVSCSGAKEYKEITEEDISVSIAHPRVFFLPEDEKKIKEKMDGDEFLSAVHQEIIRKSEYFLSSEPLEYELTGRYLLSVCREALNQMFFLAYSYRMTGDMRYAEKARALMLNVCDFPSWNPQHYLDVGEMTATVAMAYDWLYGLLSEDERRIAREAIVEKGIKTSMSQYNPNPADYYFLTKYSNWNAVCNMGLIWGALAVYEDYPELARFVIARGINSTRNYTLTEYQPDGNFPEGYTYWSYGTNFLIMMYDAIEKATGLDLGLSKNKGFMRSGEYILQMTAKNFETFRYADCGETRTKLEIPLFWMQSQTGDPTLLYREKERFDYLKSRENLSKLFSVRFLPVVMFWARKGALEHTIKPTERLFVGQGNVPVAVMRNHWGGEDEIFLGLKAGTSYNFHAHMDVGSFVMMRGDNEWFTDLEHEGYYQIEKHGIKLSEKKEDSPRWSIFRDGMYSHSLIIFDDRRQDPDAYASIVSCADNPGMIYAVTQLKDTQHNMMDSYLRGVAIVDDKYVVVRDEIEGLHSDTPIRWAAMTLAEVEMIDDHKAVLEMNGDRLFVVVEGEGIKLQTFSTKADNEFEASNEFATLIGFSANLTSGSRSVFSVYLIPEEDYGTQRPLPEIKRW